MATPGRCFFYDEGQKIIMIATTEWQTNSQEDKLREVKSLPKASFAQVPDVDECTFEDTQSRTNTTVHGE